MRTCDNYLWTQWSTPYPGSRWWGRRWHHLVMEQVTRVKRVACIWGSLSSLIGECALHKRRSMLSLWYPSSWFLVPNSPYYFSKEISHISSYPLLAWVVFSELYILDSFLLLWLGCACWLLMMSLTFFLSHACCWALFPGKTTAIFFKGQHSILAGFVIKIGKQQRYFEEQSCWAYLRQIGWIYY